MGTEMGVSMSRPFIQVGDSSREMTEEEYQDYLIYLEHIKNLYPVIED
jgi:hypothetical protein